MVSNINEDRIELKEKSRKSLKYFSRTNIGAKNGDLYIFLTNEEQEINREIDRQHIEIQALTKKIAETICRNFAR